MAAELSREEVAELTIQAQADSGQDAVAEQLQQVYEHVLEDRRPEAVGATEELARQLDVDVERPDGLPGRARR